MSESEIFLDLTEASDYTGIATSTFELLRAVELGPRRYELDGRELYRLLDLDEWRANGEYADDVRRGIGRLTDVLVDMAATFDRSSRANRTVTRGEVVPVA